MLLLQGVPRGGEEEEELEEEEEEEGEWREQRCHCSTAQPQHIESKKGKP